MIKVGDSIKFNENVDKTWRNIRFKIIKIVSGDIYVMRNGREYCTSIHNCIKIPPIKKPEYLNE